MYCETTFNISRQEGQTPNSGLAKVAVRFSADTFVVNQTFVRCIKVCGKNHHHRQTANHYCIK